MSKANVEAKVGETVASAEAISLENLSVQAGDQTLLTDVSVTFPAGEIALVVGPSGVGKSILMRIIAALINSNEPGIQWTGDVKIGDKTAVAGSAGVVFSHSLCLTRSHRLTIWISLERLVGSTQAR